MHKVIIPDLFRHTTFFLIVLVTQLFSILVTLLMRQDLILQSVDFFVQLGLVSLYCSWCVFGSMVFLNVIRHKVNACRYGYAMLFVVIACLLPFTFIELISQILFNQSDFVAKGLDSSRFVSHGLIAGIVTLFILRSIIIFSEFNKRNKAEMELKLQALQAKINPHFLFNSLNTIAELTAINPSKAENAVDSLAHVFRVSLQSADKLHSLADELSLSQKYIELERWRLQKRLGLSWSIEVEYPDQIQIPKLTLQPLIENAIVHGVLENGCIEVTISIRETKSNLSCKIVNKKALKVTSSLTDFPKDQVWNQPKGNGIALENIKMRLQALYDDKFQFKIMNKQGTFEVVLMLPKKVNIQ